MENKHNQKLHMFSIPCTFSFLFYIFLTKPKLLSQSPWRKEFKISLCVDHENSTCNFGCRLGKVGSGVEDGQYLKEVGFDWNIDSFQKQPSLIPEGNYIVLLSKYSMFIVMNRAVPRVVGARGEMFPGATNLNL